MMRMLREALAAEWARVRGVRPIASSGEPIVDGEKLIRDFAVYAEAVCPCGSQHLHRLTLVSTSECARCGRTIAIRSIDYFRRGPNELPEPRVSVGFVQTDEALGRRVTRGVH